MRTRNSEVTETYIRIIEECLQKYLNDKITIKNSVREMKGTREDYYIVPGAIEAYALVLLKKKHIFVWFQGIIPEESRMRNHSRIRYWILSFMEKQVLKKAEFSFFVSEAMRQYYIKKYNISLTNNYYIMPCFNTTLKKDSFDYPKKYENNIFTYVGSLSKWQNFDRTVHVFERIQQEVTVSITLYILTPEIEKATEILRKSKVQNCQINCVKPEEIDKELQKAKFGFILRDDIAVNRVATPTKISNYLANGVIPIYSSCIKDFESLSKELTYVLSENDPAFFSRLSAFLRAESISKDVIYNEYRKIFDNYYSIEYHKNRIMERFQNKISEGHK